MFVIFPKSVALSSYTAIIIKRTIVDAQTIPAIRFVGEQGFCAEWRPGRLYLSRLQIGIKLFLKLIVFRGGHTIDAVC